MAQKSTCLSYLSYLHMIAIYSMFCIINIFKPPIDSNHRLGFPNRTRCLGVWSGDLLGSVGPVVFLGLFPHADLQQNGHSKGILIIPPATPDKKRRENISYQQLLRMRRHFDHPLPRPVLRYSTLKRGWKWRLMGFLQNWSQAGIMFDRSLWCQTFWCLSAGFWLAIDRFNKRLKKEAERIGWKGRIQNVITRNRSSWPRASEPLFPHNFEPSLQFYNLFRQSTSKLACSATLRRLWSQIRSQASNSLWGMYPAKLALRRSADLSAMRTRGLFPGARTVRCHLVLWWKISYVVL